ncbi:hypothetical protein J1614_007780 [Plenodomus biglobosus]|nr:hypothetical protein J1614_007780 [Plenodomus biglobosus]
MSLSILSRTALAIGLLTSTVTAKFDNNSNRNVAVYWGQGSDQIPLSQVCADPDIDIVNIGFVNVFPKARGDYPGTNHANACQADYYPDPKTGQPSKLLRTCPGVEQSIKDCQASGKKVMLSLGGGYPVNYSLPTADVANYFADFLIGAYGPVTTAWSGKPRPFGSAVVDGFDLDLEAEEWATGAADLLYKNYDVFGKRVKATSKMLLSAAPQCVVPDARVAPALKAVPFDFIFAQFYNTYQCSAAKGYKDLKAGATTKSTTFTFQAWLDWLATESANKNAKLYLGLPAGPDGLPTHKDHYLNPTQADYLISQYKNKANFGGVMLWEATVSVRNPEFCKSFGYWAKTSLEGTFAKKHTQAACAVSSSAVVSSSTKVSSSKIASSTLATSTMISSSTIASSTKASSSTILSSSVHIPSSTAASSSIYMPPSSQISSVHEPTSTAAESSMHVTSGSASSSQVISSTLEGSTISATASAVSSIFETSSVYEVPSSSVYVNSSSVYVPLPTESSSKVYPSSSASIAYPDSYPTDAASSKVYPSASSTPYLSEYQSYSQSTPEAASSTSYSTSSQVYPAESSSAVYPHPAQSSKGQDVYPAESSKGYPEYAPSVTKGPEEYPSYPTDSTTTLVTTTYVDVCPTGLTTVTTVITKTICGKCAHPTKEVEYPEGWTTSVYIDETVTTTLTKPANVPTGIPVYPTTVPTVYPFDYPAALKPSAPINKEEYPSVPEIPAVATSIKAVEYPVSSQAPEYPDQPGAPEYPKKPVEDVAGTVISTLIQHVTLSKVAIPTAYAPAPYPTAPVTAPYAAVGAANGTGAYAPLPTGTGKPTKPTSYTPPEFEGAASRFGVGMTAIIAVFAGFLVL